MREWIDTLLLVALVGLEVKMMLDGHAMVSIYRGYFEERRQARKAAVTRWRAKRVDANTNQSVVLGVGSDTVDTGTWESEGGATDHRV